jgi:hypothetical protein
VAHDPDKLMPTPGGHANLGMAHGAAGLTALLALASLRGHHVPGHHDALGVLTAWFDQWRQDSPTGAWWPQWITADELRTGTPTQPAAGRPSWCYGSVGIARALQLAALALGGHQQQDAAEIVLAAALTDHELDRITDPGLCHGIAGIYQTAYRAAHDARTPAIAQRLPAVAARLTRHAHTPADSVDNGFLTGSAGIGLALHTLRRAAPPHTGWDTCLLIT